MQINYITLHYWIVPCTVWIWRLSIFICFMPWRHICQDIISLWWRYQTCYKQSCGWRIQDGWTYHKPWLFIVAYWWHLHCILSVSSIKILPLMLYIYFLFHLCTIFTPHVLLCYLINLFHSSSLGSLFAYSVGSWGFIPIRWIVF